MNEKVAQLYDQLHSAEQKLGRPEEYPIHKTLNLTQPDISDIYHWIVANFELPQQGHILDAGCGVGWGTHYLSGNTEAQVTGISISPAEINSAMQNNKSDTKGRKPTFQLCSFDNLEEQKYELIIAVESIKHCTDLNNTINCLTHALKPGGKLLVVEDLAEESASPLAQTLCQDWHLTRLYSEQDYIESCSPMQLQCFDLTHLIPVKSVLKTRIKLLTFNLVARVFPKAGQWRAFRGGFCLERLYQQKKMRYCTLLIGNKRSVL